MLSLSCMVCKIKFMGPNVLGSLNITFLNMFMVKYNTYREKFEEQNMHSLMIYHKRTTM